MVTINSSNEKTAASGKVLQGQGVGTASDFSTATYPAIATGTGTILRADGTNWVATTATYPATTGANTMLISTSANVVTTATFIASTSWTPVLAFGGGSTGITYSTQAGTYQQVGNIVWVSATLVLTSKGSSTGSATITGLPVAAVAGSLVNVGSIENATTTLPGGTSYFTCEITSGGNSISLSAFGSSAASALADTNFANSSIIRLCAFYFV
jgi:hypothetical protein